MRTTVQVSLPGRVMNKLEAYCEVSNRAIPEVIEALLTNARVDQLPIIWLEHIDPERYAQQLAEEHQQRWAQVFLARDH